MTGIISLKNIQVEFDRRVDLNDPVSIRELSIELRTDLLSKCPGIPLEAADEVITNIMAQLLPTLRQRAPAVGTYRHAGMIAINANVNTADDSIRTEFLGTNPEPSDASNGGSVPSDNMMALDAGDPYGLDKVHADLIKRGVAPAIAAGILRALVGSLRAQGATAPVLERADEVLEEADRQARASGATERVTAVVPAAPISASEPASDPHIDAATQKILEDARRRGSMVLPSPGPRRH